MLYIAILHGPWNKSLTNVKAGTIWWGHRRKSVVFAIMTHFLRSTSCFSFTDNRHRKNDDDSKDGDDEDDGGGDGDDYDDEDGDCHCAAAGVG